MKLENVMKKTALSIAGLAMLAGLSSCGPALQACKDYRCGSYSRCKADCKTQSDRSIACTPKCVYFPFDDSGGSSTYGHETGSPSEKGYR